MEKNHLDSGFTLVEVAVTLAILGIIALVAVPSIKSWRESYTLRSASQEVYAMLMRAKTEAMKRNQSCRVEFGLPGPTGMQICSVSTVNAGAACPAGTILQQSQLPTGATFAGTAVAGACAAPLANSVNGNAFAFRNNSVPVNPPFACGSVYVTVGGVKVGGVTVGGQQSRVQIDNAGNITIF